MPYSSIVERRIRQSFDHVNDHRWAELLRSIKPNIHHRFLGAHAIGGERHDRDTLCLWFERLARALPVSISNQQHLGERLALGDHRVRAVGRDSVAAGRRRILPTRHPRVITLRWGKIHVFDVFEDSQEVARALAAQATAGLDEAAAEPILS